MAITLEFGVSGNIKMVRVDFPQEENPGNQIT